MVPGQADQNPLAPYSPGLSPWGLFYTSSGRGVPGLRGGCEQSISGATRRGGRVRQSFQNVGKAILWKRGGSR